jgi:hypothetical protein
MHNSFILWGQPMLEECDDEWEELRQPTCTPGYVVCRPYYLRPRQAKTSLQLPSELSCG